MGLGQFLIVIMCCIVIVGVLVCVRSASISKGKELHQEYMETKIRRKYQEATKLPIKHILAQLFDDNLRGTD